MLMLGVLNQWKFDWDGLLRVTCRAIRAAAQLGVDNGRLQHYCCLLFKLDSGGIDNFGLTDLCLLFKQLAFGEQPQPAFAYVSRRLEICLRRDVYRKGWWNGAA